MRVAGFVAALALFAPSLAGAETKTTVYTYNADAALTSITETSDGGSKTTYFTWDNFEADPNTPSTGTVTAANGNLIGIGTTPGDDSVSSWRHDVLDRLVRVTNGQGDKARYQYHPDELLAASLNADAPDMDGLQHYYDESRYPQVTNLYDRHTGNLSSRHRRIRYLPDGTEQMLVRHRKDVDGVYELTGQTMSGYAYDPYGASLDEELTGTPPTGPLYSLATNPYRYTHEFADPVTGAYYLRARWYLPAIQGFVHRDPFQNLNRYGYANANPVMNHDPGGGSAKRFFKGIERGYLNTPNNILAMFGMHYDRHGLSFSTKNLATYWGNPINDAVLLATLVMSPAASDVAANVDMAFGGRLFAREATEQMKKSELTLAWRAAIGSQKLATTGFQHFGVNAAVLGLQRSIRHLLGQKNEQPFDVAFGEAVGGSFGMAQAGFVFKGVVELGRTGISRLVYGEDYTNAFMKNATYIVDARRNVLAGRRALRAVMKVPGPLDGEGVEMVKTLGDSAPLTGKGGVFSRDVQEGTAAARRGVRVQSLVAGSFVSKGLMGRLARRILAERGTNVVVNQQVIEDSDPNPFMHLNLTDDDSSEE